MNFEKQSDVMMNKSSDLGGCPERSIIVGEENAQGEDRVFDWDTAGSLMSRTPDKVTDRLRRTTYWDPVKLVNPHRCMEAPTP